MNYKEMTVWKDAREIVSAVYELTKTMSWEERDVMIKHLRRTAISIPSNIAEGKGRNSRKEYAQFVNIALGSATELECQIILSMNLGLCGKYSINELLFKLEGVIRMLTGLRDKLIIPLP